MRSSTWTLLTGCSLGVIAVTALIVSIVHQVKETSAFRDESFKQGQMAKQSVNCLKAISYFTQVKETASFPFNAFDGLTDLAQQQIAICDAFMTANQQAKEAVQRKNFSNALFTHYQFIEQHGKDELTQAMRNSITGLFGVYGVAKLTGSESCNAVDSLVNSKVIPNVKTNLPHFYYSCAKFYGKQGQSEQALGQYRRFLVFSPKHSLSRNVQIAVVQNPRICYETTAFQNEPTIAKLPSLLPVVYMNCSEAYYKAISYPESKGFLQTLRKHYPKHSLAKVANNWLYSINQEIKTVKAEVYRSGETIKAIIAFCNAPSLFGFGWMVDIMESVSGKTCDPYGEPLENWQRWANLIPWFGEAKGLTKVQRVYKVIEVASRWQGIEQQQVAVQDDQSLFELLRDSDSITLFARHNQKLEQLVIPRLNQPIDTSKNTQFLSYLK